MNTFSNFYITLPVSRALRELCTFARSYYHLAASRFSRTNFFQKHAALEQLVSVKRRIFSNAQPCTFQADSKSKKWNWSIKRQNIWLWNLRLKF